jgi:hypothetical protein
MSKGKGKHGFGANLESMMAGSQLKSKKQGRESSQQQEV